MVAVGDVWDRTIEFLNDRLGAVLPLAIFAIFVPTSIGNALNGVGRAGSPAVMLGLAVVAVALAVLQFWGQLAISALVVDPASRAAAVATRRLPLGIAVMLVLILGVFAIGVPLGVLLSAGGLNVMQLSGGVMTMPALSPGIAAAAVVYAIAMIVVLLVFAARLMGLTAVIVAEREGVQSVGRAFALTRRMTWRLIGVLLLYGVVLWVAATAARLVFGSVLQLVAGGDGPLGVAQVVTGVIVAAVTTSFVVLATVFSAKLYLAITAREMTLATPAPSFGVA